jgi:hypothetical protein
MRKKKSFLMRVAALAVAGVMSLGGIPLTTDTVLADTSEPQGGATYVLMNVPYAEFYAAELGDTNNIEVDGVTSATLNKPRTGTLVGGSYHVNSDGSDITGVTIPVELGEDVTVEDLQNKGGKEVTDSDSFSITVTNRGTSTTTEYKGKDALFERPSYSYYELSETPSYYKVVTKDESGDLVFGEMQGETTQLSGVTATFLTTSGYGDYQLNLTGLDSYDNLYGVVVEAKDATTGETTKYGLRHLENIWRTSNLAWCTGFTESSHGSPTSSAHYESMMGKTIDKVTYYTDQGIFEILISDTYVPVKFSAAVEDVEASAGSTTVTVSGVPEGYELQYTVLGLNSASVNGNTLTFPTNTKPGSYTLQVSDVTGAYASATASFVLYADSTPVVFDQETSALVAAEGSNEAAVEEYLKNITSVTVDGTSYPASGRGAVTIINANGTLKTDAAPFADETTIHTVTVQATGYRQDVTFNYGKDFTYVYAGLTWAEYWASEDVYLSGDYLTATSKKNDYNGESDKGAFDTVSRATTMHGLHRGSFQCTTVIHAERAGGVTKDFSVSTWKNNGETLVLTDGSEVSYSKGKITEDGTEYTLTSYEVYGIKYVPVAVKTSDLKAFKASHDVVENGETLVGGFGEQKLTAYSETAAVNADTNGLKVAVKNADGSFSFGARMTGSGSGLADQTQAIASGVNAVVQKANGSYGEFLRVYLTGDYGALASKMYAVRWTYYGDDSTYTNALASYGTKFAADNWLHKSMGIQLGLTDSLRCQLPDETDGTGYWALTVYAMGYEDYTAKFEVTAEDIVATDTTELENLIAEAETLQEADYTETTWKDMQSELAQAKATVAEEKTSLAVVNEALTNLKASVSALVKKSTEKKPENSNTSKTENAVSTETTADTETTRVETATSNATAAAAEQKKTVKKGDTYSKNKVTYQVTSTADGKQSVKVTEIKNKNVTEVTIPATISINGTSYKVTAIAKNAFAGCTKLKKVTIGKNVTSIGKNAFSGDSKLKTIIIKSKVLTKVGENAFKGIPSNATIKVPSSKVKAYKKLLTGKGQGKNVTIKK